MPHKRVHQDAQCGKQLHSSGLERQTAIRGNASEGNARRHQAAKAGRPSQPTPRSGPRPKLPR
eukprot:13901694-Alexandrium_andersonii.AAC.1